MKALFITAALMYGTLALADFPTGQYTGHGAWKDDKGNKGTYEVQTTSAPASLDNVYTYGPQTQKFKMEVGAVQNGFFDVRTGGQKVGSGYCMSVQCHYVVPAANLEESIVFWQGHLYRVGSKVVNGTRIGWEEDLQAVTK